MSQINLAPQDTQGLAADSTEESPAAPQELAAARIVSLANTAAPAESPALPPQEDRRTARAPHSEAERRQAGAERRAGVDRRVIDVGAPTGLERRRGPGRRRNDDRRSAEEGEMTDEQFEFMLAIDTYKRLNNRPFPSWTEVLEVVKQLGYRKVAASSVTLSNATSRSQSSGG